MMKWLGRKTDKTMDLGLLIPRLGRFSSVDPLANKFPTLTPYQFASNMQIWAMDQEGREALIINSATKTRTIVAIACYVTAGPSSLANTAMLKTEVESQIINRVPIANAAAQKETPGVYALNVKINSFSKDAEGNPLTLVAARDLAAKSSVSYTDMNGQSQTIQSWKTGVVVKHNDGELQNEYAIYSPDNELKTKTMSFETVRPLCRTYGI